jgi:hypothetical protein
MDISSLFFLRNRVYISEKWCEGPFTIGGHEFQRLKLFRVGLLYQLLFMPGAMPNLKHLNIQLIFTTNSYSDLGIQHLASLTKVDVEISAWRDQRGGVEDLEAKMRCLIDAHPNRPTVNFIRDFPYGDDYSAVSTRWNCGNNE